MAIGAARIASLGVEKGNIPVFVFKSAEKLMLCLLHQALRKYREYDGNPSARAFSNARQAVSGRMPDEVVCEFAPKASL